MKPKLLRRENAAVLVLTLCLILIASAFLSFAAVTHRTVKALRAALAEATEATVSAAAAPMLSGNALYKLQECGGKIGIYDATSGLLLDFVDVLVETLPKQDRLALRRGITLYSFSELAAVIEDFST